MSRTAAPLSPDRLAIAWHDLECGGYEADLPLWRESAATRDGIVLDLGCGSGRVALDLAARGHHVTGVEVDPVLAGATRDRARDRGLPVEVVEADVRAMSVPPAVYLALAPMQLLQLIDPEDRSALLHCLNAGLPPGALVAAALAEPPDTEGALPPLAGETAVIDGWVVTSTPSALRRAPGRFAIERVRGAAPPEGEVLRSLSSVELHELSPSELEHEAEEAGLRPVGRRIIPETRDYVGSTVVLLERAE